MVNNKKNNPIMDLNQLRKDYQQGYSPMGQSERGYYITNWRGMQSLQAYCTSELVQHWGGGSQESKLREVQVKEGGKQYAMKSWTYDRFEQHLVDGLNDIGVPIKKHMFGDHNVDIYEAVINNVYNGELDRTAFIDAATSRTSPMMSYDVELAMKLDILRAKDGDTDKFAKAGAFAYEKGLASQARLVDFGSLTSDEMMGPRFFEKTQEEWLSDAEKLYLDSLLEKTDGVDTVSLDSARDVIGTLQTATPKRMKERAGEWNKIVDYMKQNVVFFLDDKPEIQSGRGMTYQKDVHQVMDLPEGKDWSNSLERNDSTRIDVEESPSIDLSDDDGLDF